MRTLAFCADFYFSSFEGVGLVTLFGKTVVLIYLTFFFGGDGAISYDWLLLSLLTGMRI